MLDLEQSNRPEMVLTGGGEGKGEARDLSARLTSMPETRHTPNIKKSSDVLSRLVLRDSSTVYIILYILRDLFRRYILTIPMMATICTAVGLIVLWFIIYYSIESISS